MDDKEYSELIEDSIKEHFLRNGTLDEMRSGLHVKVLKMLRQQVNLKIEDPLCGSSDMEQRGLVSLLNQLIVEYFHWFGYKHTLETFALETGISTQPRARAKLQRELKGTFNQSELPILMQMLMKQTTDKANKMDASTMTETQSSTLRNPTIFGLPAKKGQPKHLNELHSISPPMKPIEVTSKKLNVREYMAATKKPLQLGNRNATKVEKNNTIFKQMKTTNRYDSTSTSESFEMESENDSDAFAEIPNRYYYREQEPPETTYPFGYGEEGPYNEATPRPQMINKSDTKSRLTVGRKSYEMEFKNKEKLQISKPMTMPKGGNIKLERVTMKRNKLLFQSQRRMNKSEDEPSMPVSKPKCPETMVSSIQLDGIESDDDSDDYL